MNISVILSGGIGVRFGNELPKQYKKLLGKEIISYVVEALKHSTLTEATVIVAQKSYLDKLSATYKIDCVEAGDTHNMSVRNGIDFIISHYPECKNVLFTDAARPFLSSEQVDEYYKLLADNDAVITAKNITDSLGREGEIFVDRSEYYLIQKPEAFKFNLLRECFLSESKATAIVQQLPLSAKIYKNFSSKQNIKITYPDDIALAEYLIGMQI